MSQAWACRLNTTLNFNQSINIELNLTVKEIENSRAKEENGHEPKGGVPDLKLAGSLNIETLLKIVKPFGFKKNDRIDVQ